MDLTVTQTKYNYSISDLKNKLISTINKGYPFYNISGDANKMITRVYLTNIVDDDIYLKFKEEYPIEVYLEDDYYFCDIDIFDIHAYGTSKKELLNDIYSSIVFLWKHIVLINDDELNVMAIELKRKILALIEEA